MKREEDAIHLAIARLLATAALPGVVWWHTPNGGSRGKAEAGRFKAMGVKPGVPDFIVAMPDGSMAFIEVKAKTGRLSTEQRDFLGAMKAAGHKTSVVRSLAEAVADLECWGAIRGARVAA